MRFKKTKTKCKKIVFTAPLSLDKEIEALSKKTLRTKADIMRTGISEYIKECTKNIA